MEKVQTQNAPKAIGPYSQAIVSGNLIFTSGQIPLDSKMGEIVAGGIKEQTKQACENLREVLIAAGSSLENVVKTTCFLANIADFAQFNDVYAQFFTTNPARSCFEVAALPKNALVEIEVIAEK